MKFKYLSIIALLFVLSCTPKTTEQIVEQVEEPVVKEKVECATFNDLGRKQSEAMESFILYKDLVKEKDYKAAYPLWQKAM